MITRRVIIQIYNDIEIMVMFLGKIVQTTNTFILSSVIENNKSCQNSYHQEYCAVFALWRSFLPFKHKSILGGKSLPSNQS